MIVLSLSFVFPFLWMILSSFKANKEVLAIPVTILPEIWTIDAYLNNIDIYGYEFDTVPDKSCTTNKVHKTNISRLLVDNYDMSQEFCI